LPRSREVDLLVHRIDVDHPGHHVVDPDPGQVDPRPEDGLIHGQHGEVFRGKVVIVAPVLTDRCAGGADDHHFFSFVIPYLEIEWLFNK